MSIQSNMIHIVRQKNEIDWKKLDKDWVCINTDGAVEKNLVVGCGGLARNNNGDWLCGLSKNVGICNVYFA